MKIPNFLVWNWIWNILMYNLKVYFTIWSKSWFICDVIVYIGPQLRSFCAEQLNWYWRNLAKCRFSVNRCNGWNAIANAPFDDLREQNCWIRIKAKGHVSEKLLFAITKKALPKKSRFSKTCMVFLVVIKKYPFSDYMDYMSLLRNQRPVLFIGYIRATLGYIIHIHDSCFCVDDIFNLWYVFILSFENL